MRKRIEIFDKCKYGMITCKVCGYKAEPNTKFCPDCGLNLTIQSSGIEDEVKKLKENSPDNNIDDLNISKEFLDKYQQILKQIEDLEYVDAELQTQRNQTRLTAVEVNTQRQRVANLKRHMDEQFEDVKRLQNVSIASVVSRIKGDRQARIEQEEAEYLAAKEKLNVAETTLQDLLRQAEEAKRQLALIEEMNDYKVQLKAELNQLVFKIGEQMRHPEEDKLEEDISRMRNELQPIQQEFTTISNCMEYLQSARQNFSRALSSLDSAKNYADYDSFLGGGFWADSAKHSNYDKAKHEIRRGQYNLQHAYNLNPHLPRLREVHLETGGEFFDIWFDNVFSDFQMRNRIKQARYRVREAIDDINHVIGETGSHLRDLESRKSSLTQQINVKNQELKQIRIEIIEALIGS